MSQKENGLTQELCADWLLHPVTLAFRRHLQEQLESLREHWSRGHFSSPRVDESAMLNANAIGQSEVLIAILDSQPDEFFTDKDVK